MGEEGKQSPVCAAKQKECDGSDQSCPKRRIIPGVPQAGTNRTTQPLDRKGAFHRFPGAPREERSDHAEIAEAVHPEWCGEAEAAGEDAPQRRSYSATDVHSHAVRRDCGTEIFLWHKLGYDSEPCRPGERDSCAAQQREQEEVQRRGEIEPYDRGKDRSGDGDTHLTKQKEPALVEDIGKCTGRNCQKKHWNS